MKSCSSVTKSIMIDNLLHSLHSAYPSVSVNSAFYPLWNELGEWQ